LKVSSDWKIREIEPSDNSSLATVLRTVLLEMGVPKVGTAYADPELDSMYQAYDVARSAYFVVTYKNQVLGGAGIAPLADEDATVCELQKMYFSPKSRGLGLGKKMIQICLNYAKNNGFTQCYLETMPNMKQAQGLYQHMGFQYIKTPLGNTGHFSCPVWMIKSLN
jgi:putative acetyltransferase